MNSLDKLLTNSTNRFSGSQSSIFPQFHSNFTPIHKPQHDLQPSQSKNYSLISQLIDIQVPQSYEQLQQMQKQLIKILQEAKQEKQVMTALFDKILSVEQGKQERLKKRFRRKKNQIQGKYACGYCEKVYSSSTSLARHVKLKHPYSMMQPPQRDYQIPPQPNSINQNNEDQQLERKESEIRGMKRGKLFDESYQGNFESLQESDESQQEVMFSQQLS